ncbi:MAG TPA: hypothetical protein VG297_26560 [Bryobacteraceae bacterium]|jgi:hypothetical protein|nr:hypothetical protein [Bryobacteraceae bacterium]
MRTDEYEMLYIGIDIGKSVDPAAIVIVGRLERRLTLCYAERLALGTPYPDLAEHVRWIATHEKVRGRCAMAVDATGVGAPVVDMLRAGRMGCEIASVVISGGEKTTSGSGNRWTVPKRDLLTGVQVLLQRGELRIAPTLKEAGTLVRELTNVRMTPGNGGAMRMGADGFGEHDDLVIALALACWRAVRPQNGFGTRRLPGI